MGRSAIAHNPATGKWWRLYLGCAVSWDIAESCLHIRESPSEQYGVVTRMSGVGFDSMGRRLISTVISWRLRRIYFTETTLAVVNVTCGYLSGVQNQTSFMVSCLQGSLLTRDLRCRFTTSGRVF